MRGFALLHLGLFRRLDRNARSRYHSSSNLVGGSTTNLNALGHSSGRALGHSPGHAGHSRSERDLTKVTKVRVKSSRDESGGGGGGSTSAKQQVRV